MREKTDDIKSALEKIDRYVQENKELEEKLVRSSAALSKTNEDLTKNKKEVERLEKGISDEYKKIFKEVFSSSSDKIKDDIGSALKK